MSKISPLKPALAHCPAKWNDISITADYAGIKAYNRSRNDMVFFRFRKKMHFCGVYTRSETAAAPVKWCQKIEAKASPIGGLLVNAGNANSCTGDHGQNDIEELLAVIAEKYREKKENFLMCSTGVIGERLPVIKMKSCCQRLCQNNHREADFIEAASAIMTTDTFAKYLDKRMTIDNQAFRITAIAKGAGMIAPDMATMLVFIFTDFPMNGHIRRMILTHTVNNSFNLISIDNDSSTNDTVLLFSPDCDKKHYRQKRLDRASLIFKKELEAFNKELAEMIVRDAEGISKLIRIKIDNAKSLLQAKKIGFAIANSPLCKTAISGGDANWGRIMMAVGKAKAQIDIEKLKLRIGENLVFTNGYRAHDYDEQSLTNYMKNNEIIIRLDLSIGKRNIEILTSDLSKEYVAINADYRS